MFVLQDKRSFLFIYLSAKTTQHLTFFLCPSAPELSHSGVWIFFQNTFGPAFDDCLSRRT